MSPVERKANERAMHESYLVIKASPSDMGARPLTGPFAAPEVTVGPDGRPRAVVWNLGNREVSGVITEFAAVPAGVPVRPENRKIIGYGTPAIIGPNSSIALTCNAIWPRLSTADVLLVTASHPESDPVKSPCDPLADRHVGQMNYAWAGRYEGRLGGAGGNKFALEIRPANKGLYRVRVFLAINGRIPSNPQIDRTMAPSGAVFRWQEQATGRKDDWDLAVLDNQRLSVHCRSRMLDKSRPDEEQTGISDRT
ncbi:MAG TPA: hypothetical protein VGK74_20895 [Symbiobacteriaceae bacterium]|jgi:hypothetical protein